MAQPVLVDLRNVYQPDEMSRRGFRLRGHRTGAGLCKCGQPCRSIEVVMSPAEAGHHADKRLRFCISPDEFVLVGRNRLRGR